LTKLDCLAYQQRIVFTTAAAACHLVGRIDMVWIDIEVGLHRGWHGSRHFAFADLGDDKI